MRKTKLNWILVIFFILNFGCSSTSQKLDSISPKKNDGLQSHSLNQLNFSYAVYQPGLHVTGFYSEHLPREFKRIDPLVIGENISKVGFVIMAYALVTAEMFYFASHPSNLSRMGESPTNPNGSINVDYKNSTESVHLNYSQFLLKEMSLAPSQEVEKLLFFYAPDSITSENLKVLYNPI